MLWVYLWSCNIQMHSKLGCSHHEGMNDIISITNPSNSAAMKTTKMLLVYKNKELLVHSIDLSAEFA